MRWALIAVCASVLLAGCQAPTQDQIAAFEVEIEAPDFRPFWQGEPIFYTFTMVVDGIGEASSDHIGAHYSRFSAGAEPSLAVYSSACGHTGGELPGTFEVTCEFTEPDVYHVVGHVRLTNGEESLDLFSQERRIDVLPVYDLELSGVPSNATAGEPFNVTVEVIGNQPFSIGLTSDHIGAHYRETSVDDSAPDDPPSRGLADDPNACDHASGELPGTYTVTCTIEEPGTWYVRGHMLLHDFMHYRSDEHEIQVS